MEKIPNNIWEPLGHLFSSESYCDWAVSHSSLPTVMQLTENRYRVYFSARDSQQKSHLGFFEFDPSSPLEVLSVCERPAFSPGRLGSFDSDGVYGTSFVRKGSKIYCYYGGWNCGERGIFYSSIGVCVSDDNGKHFYRMQEHPILSRDEYDHWAVLAPFVGYHNSSWNMWYVSGIEIATSRQGIESRYDLKLATSKNGLSWRKTGKSAIELGANSTNISRTCILKSKLKYHAWYSFVDKGSKSYRIGYAVSSDGIIFDRLDNEFSIDYKKDKWVGTARAYPYVFFANNKFYMMYNGEQNGRSGIGIASCEPISC